MDRKLTRLALLTLVTAIVAASFSTPRAAAPAGRKRFAPPGVGVIVNFEFIPGLPISPSATVDTDIAPESIGPLRKIVRPAVIIRTHEDESVDLMLMLSQFDLEVLNDVHTQLLELDYVKHDEARTLNTWHFVDRQSPESN